MSALAHVTLGNVLKWFLFLVVGSALVWYALFQSRLLISGPSLTLHADTKVPHDTRVVTVAGAARNVTAITLNDRPIFTDDEGNFHEQLVLENGYTILTLRARDRYGRETILEQPFVYAPAYAQVQKP